MFNERPRVVPAPSWTTATEIEWLNTIGTHHESGRLLSSHGRAQLLQGALNGYALRDSWGGIDKGKVVDHAALLLAQCGEGSLIGVPQSM